MAKEPGNPATAEVDNPELDNSQADDPESAESASGGGGDEPLDDQEESDEEEEEDEDGEDSTDGEGDELDDDEDGPDRPSDNPAVHRCIRAWNRAYRKAINDAESDYNAKRTADRAYLNVMPPLSGFENIRDFVACVTYASVTDGIRHRDAEHLLDAAKVALGALRHQPKPTPRSAGIQKKS